MLLAELGVVLSLAVRALPSENPEQPTAASRREVARDLHLTDLALGSGSAYSRHPSQADSFAPFSEHPGALEHLPSGSVVPLYPPGGEPPVPGQDTQP